MSTYQKSVLAILVIGVALTAVVAGGRGAAVATASPGVVGSTPNPGGGIATFGDATVRVKPDIAILNLGATATAVGAADAQNQVATRVAQMLKVARALGIADKDIKTRGYNLSPAYGPNYGQTGSKAPGYTASEQLSFTLRDVTRVGAALDALAGDSGATNVSIQFALEDRRPAQAEARAQAIADARSKAEAMARAGGVKVGALLGVSDVGPSYSPGPLYAAAASAGPSATVVPVGDLDVEIRVQVQFAIG